VKSIGKTIKHEIMELLPPVIFFFIAFHILAFSRALMLRQYGVSMSAVAGVAVGALVAGKVVLLADLLPFINRFPDKPLVYNILWKTMIYVIAAVIIHYLEELIPLWWRAGDFSAANRKLFDEIVWPHFWALQLWLSVLLFVYCAGRELTRALGPKEVRRMLFGTPAHASRDSDA
jgi:hypothetical protein